LDAADGAAPLLVALGNPILYYKCTTKRMCAALRVLLEIHRETLQVLMGLDAQFTGQWMGTNFGNTASAGLGIASAVCLFVVPPVGVGLGVGSAITAGLAFTGDVIADSAHHSIFRKQLSRDAFHAFVVGELLKQWAQAQQSLGSSGKQSCWSTDRSSDNQDSIRMEQAIDGGLFAGGVVNGVASKAGAGGIVAGASRAFGIAGALIQTGVAIRGWTSTSSGQQLVRSKTQELLFRILQIQHLLAAVDRLECHACSENITLADDVIHCKGVFHCFHARCIRHLERRGTACCPLCGDELNPESELMIESVADYKQSLHAKGRSSCGCCDIQRASLEASIPK
jgi:hypothetical protein